MAKLLINTDGGARGNPGPAAIGVVIKIQNGGEKEIHVFGKIIGETTNNAAEYQAVIEGLRWLKINIDNLPALSEIKFLLDSNLVVNQLNNKFKVKDQELLNFFYTIKQLEKTINITINYKFIPRNQNFQADFLVNQALDKVKLK